MAATQRTRSSTAATVVRSPEHPDAAPTERGRGLGRAFAVGGVTTAAILALAVYNLSQGEPDASLAEVWRAVATTQVDGEVLVDLLIRDLRLPRVLVAVLAGAALGVAGVLLQDSLRNPLADPGLLGVAGGASLAVAVAFIFPEISPPLPTTVQALIGGTLAGGLVLFAAGGSRDQVRMILVGALMAMGIGTITMLLILLAPFERTQNIVSYQRFVIGSLDRVRWDEVALIAPWVVVGIPLALLSARALNLLQLGDEIASSAGLNPVRARVRMLAIAMVLVTPQVPAIGPIGFVALFSPHLCRRLLRSTDARRLLPVSGLVGALLLLIADTFGRLLFFPVEVPAGVFTWIIVGPVALFLVGRVGSRSAT